jgi:hypothetical protein
MAAARATGSEIVFAAMKAFFRASRAACIFTLKLARAFIVAVLRACAAAATHGSDVGLDEDDALESALLELLGVDTLELTLLALRLLVLDTLELDEICAIAGSVLAANATRASDAKKLLMIQRGKN